MHALAAQDSGASFFLGGLIWLAVFAAYWLPVIILIIRRGNVPSPGSVIVVNAFLGWTLVGWVVALAMACRDSRPMAWPPPYQQPPPPPQGRAR